MHNLKSLLTGSLLALTLACGAVLAAPISYHVDVSTTNFASEGSGYLELNFAGPGTAADATALISKLTGVDPVAAILFDSASNPAAGQYLLGAPGDGGLWQAVTFGGMLGFDVTFDGLAGGSDGVRFTVALVGQADYLTPSIVQIDLFPGQAPQIQGSDIALVGPVVDVPADVPEPSTLLSMLTGMSLLGYAMRRRAR
jgi:hypothetical protein